jgi:hypothetical protein
MRIMSTSFKGYNRALELNLGYSKLSVKQFDHRPTPSQIQGVALLRVVPYTT